MNVLIAYNVLSSALDRFLQVQEIQKQLWPAASQYDRMVVSDVPLRVGGSFGISTIGFQNVLCDRFGQDGAVNVCAARNVGLAYGLEHGYDYVLLLDVDLVLLSEPINIGPAFSCSWNYHSVESEVRSNTFDLDAKTPRGEWNGGGLFYVPKEAIAAGVRWDEGFSGHYWEDFDFFHALVASGFEGAPFTPRTMHVWH